MALNESNGLALEASPRASKLFLQPAMNGSFEYDHRGFVHIFSKADRFSRTVRADEQTIRDVLNSNHESGPEIRALKHGPWIRAQLAHYGLPTQTRDSYGKSLDQLQKALNKGKLAKVPDFMVDMEERLRKQFEIDAAGAIQFLSREKKFMEPAFLIEKPEQDPVQILRNHLLDDHGKPRLPDEQNRTEVLVIREPANVDEWTAAAREIDNIWFVSRDTGTGKRSVFVGWDRDAVMHAAYKPWELIGRGPWDYKKRADG